MGAAPFVEIRGLSRRYVTKTGLLKQLSGQAPVVDAVSNVSFQVDRGEIVGLVGESGCGKTTLGRMLLRLEAASEGSIRVGDYDLGTLRGRKLRHFRQAVQMVFQDPYDSLNPQRTILQTIKQPLDYLGIGTPSERRQRAMEALERVELRPTERYADLLPHMLSGGQRQRVAIARALVVQPKFIVADEPVSMLDVSVRASVLNLLRRLNRETGIPILYITHDLATASFLCDRIMVMYLGKIVEVGATADVIHRPVHPYSRLLLSSIPHLYPVERERLAATGEVPSAVDPPSGCRFRTRCPFAMDICREEEPKLRELRSGHTFACHLEPDATPTTPIT